MPETAAISASPVAPSRLRIPELLAPAGDWECARAAVENGADAIYFGLEKFNARMRAKNFTQADLPELMRFLHSRGVRGYVTFNTLVFTGELGEAESYLRGIISAGADAAIVQDVGVCRLIRKLSPDFPIHCSTQMSITSSAGISFARELGANLVVLARENSLAEIGKIHADQVAHGGALPLEVFVHGALCVAYSGQCLTSESLGGRSANRGECAQACRLPYDLISDGALVPLGDRKYLLSPQDLSGLEVLPELVAAGVSSLKIEGRLKSPEYVASITRVYRAALDRMAAAASENPPADPAEKGENGSARYELEMSFSRGLSTGWFSGIDNQKLVHARFGTKRGVYLGKILRVKDEAVFLSADGGPIKPGDGVVFDAGMPDRREEGGRVYEVFPRGLEIELRFGRGDLDWSKVAAGQRLWKTNDPALDRDVRSTFTGEKIRCTQAVDFALHGNTGDIATLIVTDRTGNFVAVSSREKIATALSQPLTEERIRLQLQRLGGTPFHLGKLESGLDANAILPVSELNQMRREAVAKLIERRAAPARWTLVETASSAATVPPELTAGKKAAELIAVIRLPEQLEPAWMAGARTIYCEFENPKNYRATVARFRELALADATGEIWVAAPRIFKPGEKWILDQVRSANATGYLARNFDHLEHFAGERMRGDFSLNVANPLTAHYFFERYGLERVTASYDLNLAQLTDFLRALPGSRIEITIHQHMPLFHMEHCVFCAFLSAGKDYRDCGRPCDNRRVSLRDRVGAQLPLRADAGCRNTVYNNRAQTGAEYVTRLRETGAQNFRVEFLNDTPEEVRRTLTRYQQLLRGEISGSDLWRELKLIDQIGVTRGQMEGRAGSAGLPA